MFVGIIFSVMHPSENDKRYLHMNSQHYPTTINITTSIIISTDFQQHYSWQIYNHQHYHPCHWFHHFCHHCLCLREIQCPSLDNFKWSVHIHVTQKEIGKDLFCRHKQFLFSVYTNGFWRSTMEEKAKWTIWSRSTCKSNPVLDNEKNDALKILPAWSSAIINLIKLLLPILLWGARKNWGMNICVFKFKHVYFTTEVVDEGSKIILKNTIPSSN